MAVVAQPLALPPDRSPGHILSCHTFMALNRVELDGRLPVCALMASSSPNSAVAPATASRTAQPTVRSGASPQAAKEFRMLAAETATLKGQDRETEEPWPTNENVENSQVGTPEWDIPFENLHRLYVRISDDPFSFSVTPVRPKGRDQETNLAVLSH
ncbi:hypothetical protein ACFY3G_46550 [Streptomyces phaeochromogenes]|uniref:hypothetical protein n=1 Tax=Streptomyces phaeochromogenes TaxID=1923 RepID=UPI0036AF5D88